MFPLTPIISTIPPAAILPRQLNSWLLSGVWPAVSAPRPKQMKSAAIIPANRIFILVTSFEKRLRLITPQYDQWIYVNQPRSRDETRQCSLHFDYLARRSSMSPAHERSEIFGPP